MTWPPACTRRDELLANHTSFRIGGPADCFAEPSTLEELEEVLRAASRAGMPVVVIGGGTNTLAADRGIRGVVLHLGAGFRTIHTVSEPESPVVDVVCGAALLTQRLVSCAAQEGWGEVDALAGLPGHIGGAVSMNAQNIGRWVQEIRLVAFDGAVHVLTREQMQFHYRDAALPPGIIAQVVLRVPRVPVPEAAAGIARVLYHRNTTQEVGLPSAGCAFKNPPGLGAGGLIDQAGLKGSRIGDAQISRRHANFLVNLGQARCDDVLSLMEYVQRQVYRTHRVWLEPEVRLVGQRF